MTRALKRTRWSQIKPGGLRTHRPCPPGPARALSVRPSRKAAGGRATRAPAQPEVPQSRLPSSPRWRGGGSGARSWKVVSPSCCRVPGPRGGAIVGQRGNRASARAPSSRAAQESDVIRARRRRGGRVCACSEPGRLRAAEEARASERGGVFLLPQSAGERRPSPNRHQ